MRILFITSRFHPEIGGVEKHTYKVAQELINCGIQISIITSTQKKTLPPSERQNKMQIYRLALTNKGNKKQNAALNLAKMWFFLLRNFRLFIENDIIHLHDHQTFLWISPFLPFFKKPLFITFHGFEGYPITKNAKITRKIAEKTVNGSICVGDFIPKWYGTQPEYITIGGVETPNLTSNSYEDAAFFSGRLANDTGILDLVEALRLLKEDYDVEVPLHICGDGPLRKKIEDDAKNNGQQIFVHGFVEKPQIYLTNCRYAFASGYLSILEAMSYRKPVFAFYNNPLKRDYLYSFPDAEKLMIIASSPRDLAAKIYAAIKNAQQTVHLIEHAHEFARKQTWSKVAGIYLELYQKHGE